jgi:hypothetical protein
LFTGIHLFLQPLSQNHVGEEKFFGWPNEIEWLGNGRNRFRRDLERFGLIES